VSTLSPEIRSDVDSALADLKKALDGSDDAAIKSGTERLATASQALGTAMYAGAASATSDDQGAPGAAGATPGDATEAAGASSTSEEDVVDAEIIDEEKSEK
jgi:molecular chaperone DnaK